MTLYCPDCHVELASHHKRCPLCQAIPQTSVPEGEIDLNHYPAEPVIEQLPSKSVRQLIIEIWEILSVLALIAIFAVFFTDIITSNTLTWSKFSILSIAAGWALLTGLVFLVEHIKLLMTELTVVILLLLLLLDYFVDWQFSWFTQLALPITLLSSLYILIAVGMTIRLHKPVLALAVILFTTGVFTLSLDIIISRYLIGKYQITWSIYVLISTTMVTLFLVYIQFRFFNTEEKLNQLKAKFMI